MRNVLLIIISFIFIISCNKEDRLTWTAINVNSTGKQGDAHLISKNGRYFMIDTGQYYYVKRTLLPFLHSKHISYIDSILITHPHFDHYGGITELMKSNIKIGKIYFNIPTKKKMESEPWGGSWDDILNIIKVAKMYHIPIVPIKAGDIYRLDKNSYFKVLYAYDGIHTPVGVTDINDMSAIVMLYHGKNRFLFTGDLNKKLGKYLGEHAKDIQADILKFPHHGTEGFAPNIFFKSVNPKVVIVPGPASLWCSKRSKRARELVKDNNYTAYINGFHGNITVISNGDKYWVKTQKNPKDICRDNK